MSSLLCSRIAFRVVAILSVLVPLCAAQGLPSECKKIRVNDELRITVQNEPDLSGWVVVRSDDTIWVPLVRSIQAAGLTTCVLGEVLANGLRTYTRSPQTTVVLEDRTARERSARPRKWLSEPERPRPFLLPPLYPSASS